MLRSSHFINLNSCTSEVVDTMYSSESWECSLRIKFTVQIISTWADMAVQVVYTCFSFLTQAPTNNNYKGCLYTEVFLKLYKKQKLGNLLTLIKVIEFALMCCQKPGIHFSDSLLDYPNLWVITTNFANKSLRFLYWSSVQVGDNSDRNYSNNRRVPCFDTFSEVIIGYMKCTLPIACSWLI